MKKIKLTLVSLSTLILPIITFAQVPSSNPPVNAINGINGLVSAIENFMWVIFGGIAVVMFVVAGILFLTAQGQPEKIQAARSALIWGVAGVVVAILAYSIILIVRTAIGA